VELPDTDKPEEPFNNPADLGNMGLPNDGLGLSPATEGLQAINLGGAVGEFKPEFDEEKGNSDKKL